MTDAPMTANTGDWPEDFEHENGNYMCRCTDCGNSFTGYKRRVTCKVCAGVPNANTSTEAVRNSTRRLNDDCSDAEHGHESSVMVFHKDLRILLASHEAQAAEIERLNRQWQDSLNERLRPMHGDNLLDEAAERHRADQAALSEHKAVLDLLSGSVRAFFAKSMTIPPEQRVKFERLKDALTRATALMGDQEQNGPEKLKTES